MLGSYWPHLLLMAALIFCSSFFSASETSFAASNKLRIKRSALEGDKRAILADRINEDFPSFLATILIGNNLANTAFSAVATVVAAALFPNYAELIASVGATLLILVFAEILPKIIAHGRPDTLVKLTVRPVRVFMVLFSPVTAAVTAFVNWLSPLWTPKTTEPSVTDEELVEILESIEDEGIFTEREGDLIRSAIEFSDVTAREILVPRVDVAAIDIDADISEILGNSELLSYSRVPVYKGNIDNIIGILSTKKLIKAVIAGEEVNIKDMLSPPVFVHMTRNISSILKEFRDTQLQMAVVIDEFGGTMGILTLEDIMEEIVGDIFDESDEVKEEIVKVDENSYEVSGGMNIHDMFDILDFNPRGFESDYTTVGGWAVEMLDRFPVPGDKFDYENLTITVLEAESMRVEKLRVDVNSPEEKGEN
ncbi:MAG TPA: HlyC/CorC family transporter [Clostridiales bacterium]|nr:HlyC/CorC family transporter [Clostridiales bacterium]